MKRALQPALKNVVLDWGELAGKVAQAPAALPPIFDGDKCVIYGTVKAGETIPDTGSVTLSAVLHDEPVSFEITYDLAAASSSIIVNVRLLGGLGGCTTQLLVLALYRCQHRRLA